ncbi:mutator type transposase [Tanacetum coccineum]
MRQLRRNDVVREEMNGVANDVDDDASISGKEADLETFVNLSINGGGTYQCKGPWMDQCVVNMRFRTCTGRRWELTDIPCKHVVATIDNIAANRREISIPYD